jgi:hypothetical protein
METVKNLEAARPEPLYAPRRTRRRLASHNPERGRYFLPKTGSSIERPELGQEVASEGEALVAAFKAGQLFYTLLAWSPLPEMNGGEAKIVKQPYSAKAANGDHAGNSFKTDR